MDCTMGCTVEGEHLAECVTPWSSRRWLAEGEHPCGGCVPLQAEEGRLCWWHGRQLRRWLSTAGEQHAALLEDLEPGQRAGEAPVSGSRAPVVPISLTPLDTAAELARLLSGLVDTVARLHPDDPPPARMLTMWDRQTDDPVRARADRATGRVRATEPDPVWAPATAASWLRARWARLAAAEVIATDLPVLGEVMGQAHRLAPIAAHLPQRLACIPCPACHRLGLVRYPAEDIVECCSCREVMDQAGYRAWVREVQAACA